ncbi:anti-sigma factor domain-containing protein [Microbispora hainanensis]|uniref:Regulator of SigK n=1 Tax=Microbispora hainanensis TaxID=568844 RepID=A0A544YN71_9ACTN|nr:anti-sigma factor [Microbispora hainanensis]TQS18012.1 anti-sigma factor [Microbispora hainanensis]
MSEPHTLAGAYALDAIDDDLDRRRFEEHLAVCEECAQEVAGLAEAAARLGQAVAVEPPPGMRAAVMAEIGRVRQLPPAVAAPGPAPRPAPIRGRRRDTTARTRRWPRVAAGLAAVGVAASLVLGVIAVRTQDELERLRAGDRQVAAVLAAPDARTASGSVSGTGAGRGATGTVVVSPSQGRLVFVSSGLSTLPPSRTYQLWRIAPDGVESAGLLRPDGSGHVPPVIVDARGGVEKVGVTVEPAGGSRQPTTQPILLLDVQTA